jgi:hypothetical protein
MSLNIGSDSKYANRLTVWEIDDKGTFASGKASSSRKDKRLPEGEQWINSSWFCRFVGKAYEKSSELTRGSRIEILSGTIAQEPYEKDGETLYPKSPQITIFDFAIPSPSEGGVSTGRSRTGLDTPPAIDNDDDIPF